MSVDRHIKTVKVYVETKDSEQIKINELEFQETTIPEDSIITPTPFIDYDLIIGEWILNSGLLDGYVPMIDVSEPSGISWGTGFGKLYMQISISGGVGTGYLGPPIPVPRACTINEIVKYSRYGTYTVEPRVSGVAVSVGSILAKNDILYAYVSVSSVDCEDLVIQVRGT